MTIEDYIEVLEKGLLEMKPTWRRCLNCERVFHDQDMMSDEYCDRCWHFVDACEAERIAWQRDADAESDMRDNIERRYTDGK